MQLGASPRYLCEEKISLSETVAVPSGAIWVIDQFTVIGPFCAALVVKAKTSVASLILHAIANLNEYAACES